ncbi:MAG: glycosyltransferase [Pseudomonadales bacterium]
MAERSRVLLQVCANDHPPFADICLFHEAAARTLGWQPLTVMLERRAAVPSPGFHYLDAPPGGDAAALRAFARTHLAASDPRLLLCHRYRAWRAAAAAVPGPLVALAHEFGLLDRRRRRWQLRWDAWRRARTVTLAGVSPAVAAELAARTGRPVEVLPNGLDLARADAARLDRPAARAALGVAGEAFCIGVIGRLHPKKRPELAVDAFRQALPTLGDARLLLIGDGELRAALTRRARGLPVTLTGFVADAARCLPALDLLLLTSGEREAFAMVALEAMAAGVPVLHAAAPGPDFVVGDPARRVDPGTVAGLAAALTAAADAWRAGRLAAAAAAARQRAENTFSVAAGAARLSHLAAGIGSATA